MIFLNITFLPSIAVDISNTQLIIRNSAKRNLKTKLNFQLWISNFWKKKVILAKINKSKLAFYSPLGRYFSSIFPIQMHNRMHRILDLWNIPDFHICQSCWLEYRILYHLEGSKLCPFVAKNQNAPLRAENNTCPNKNSSNSKSSKCWKMWVTQWKIWRW